ncbi:unnamed protein product, partial [Phaeothamnion confervicola]
MRRKAIRAALIKRAADVFSKDTAETTLIAPISPTPPALIDRVLDALQLTAEDVVVDLGCGDGRWLFQAAANARCHCRGYERNPAFVSKARESASAQNLANLVTIEATDIFEAPLAGATVVIVYLFR